MRILHISTADNSGGAARAAFRLKEALEEREIQSRFLVRWKVTNDPDVELLANTSLLKIGDKISGKIGDWLSLQYLFYPSTCSLPQKRSFIEADIIQLHNIHGNFFAFPALMRLSKIKPVVWYLHDMWPMTGHASYTENCDCWKKGPVNCSCPSSAYPPLRRNTSALLWKIKKWVYDRSQLTIVAPSKWLTDVAKVSPLFSKFEIHHIPYTINSERFLNTPKSEARQALGLPVDKKIILIGSQYIDDPRKGSEHLKHALNIIYEKERPDWLIVTIGKGDATPLIPQSALRHCLGEIFDDKKLALAYSSADIFLLPTLADNLPLTIMESMSCGTAVVSYDVGGVPDMVHHMKTGYIAKYKDVQDLAKGIELLLGDDMLRKKMSVQGRRIILEKYTHDKVGAQFLELYSHLLAKKKREA